MDETKDCIFDLEVPWNILLKKSEKYLPVDNMFRRFKTFTMFKCETCEHQHIHKCVCEGQRHWMRLSNDPDPEYRYFVRMLAWNKEDEEMLLKQDDDDAQYAIMINNAFMIPNIKLSDLAYKVWSNNLKRCSKSVQERIQKDLNLI